MKYIRTEDGIYETKNLINVELEDERFKNIYRDENWVLFEVIKESDTIEELCDEFVYGIDKINEKPLVAQQNFLETKIKIAKLFKCDLYGAIWTDKGLIYVAKMNDKGELELI